MIKAQKNEMDWTSNNIDKIGYAMVIQSGNLKRSCLVRYRAVVRSRI
jgi:hypothetical protein